MIDSINYHYIIYLDEAILAGYALYKESRSTTLWRDIVANSVVLKDRNYQDVMTRYEVVLNPDIKKGPWLVDEGNFLSYVLYIYTYILSFHFI